MEGRKEGRKGFGHNSSHGDGSTGTLKDREVKREKCVCVCAEVVMVMRGLADGVMKKRAE